MSDVTCFHSDLSCAMECFPGQCIKNHSIRTLRPTADWNTWQRLWCAVVTLRKDVVSKDRFVRVATPIIFYEEEG